MVFYHGGLQGSGRLEHNMIRLVLGGGRPGMRFEKRSAISGCRGAAPRAHGPATGPCDSSLEALKQQWQVRHCFRPGDANQHETSCVRDPNVAICLRVLLHYQASGVVLRQSIGPTGQSNWVFPRARWSPTAFPVRFCWW